MKTLQFFLWLAALGCLLAVPFVFLPWSTLDSLFSWFGIDPLPDTPIALYFYRLNFGIFGLIGVFFILLAKNPLDYGPMLNLGAFGLILTGVLAMLIGFSIALPPIVYLGDGLFGLVIGLAILWASGGARRALNS